VQLPWAPLSKEFQESYVAPVAPLPLSKIACRCVRVSARLCERLSCACVIYCL